MGRAAEELGWGLYVISQIDGKRSVRGNIAICLSSYIPEYDGIPMFRNGESCRKCRGFVRIGCYFFNYVR